MFENLTDKLELTFKRLRGQGKITEKNVEESLRDVRLALLEADVNYRVVKGFVESIKAKALGQEVLLSLTPDQQLIKIVQQELIAVLGGQREELNLKGPPPQIVLVVGLQGSGKTTTLAKLASYFKREKNRTPYLVPADIYRPAAAQQLMVLAEEIGVPIHRSHTNSTALAICQEALREAKKRFCDLVLVDTAGRLHIDKELMEELEGLQVELQPHHILLVADAMTGQDAVNQAQSFNEALNLTGIILTKMDGDARGGAALSMRQVVGKPILFVGVGEKLNALEPFAPDRLASRILGMGDVLTLIEKAEQAHGERVSRDLEKRVKKGAFSLEDFQTQLKTMRKMGSVADLVDMIPGTRKLTQNVNLSEAEKEIKRVEAIINSMTREERRQPNILNGSRRRRIASGSGTTVTEVNRLMKQFLQMKKMMQKMTKMRGRGAMGRLPFSFGS